VLPLKVISVYTVAGDLEDEPYLGELHIKLPEIQAGLCIEIVNE